MVPICPALAFALITNRLLLADPTLVVPASEATRYAQAFNAIQQQTRTFRADLRQVLQLQGVSKPIVSLGTIYYRAPRQMLLRFSQPAGEWMLINGSHLEVKKQGQPIQDRDLADTRMPSHAASLLDFFHSDASHWNKDFQVTMSRSGDLLQVHLKPYLTPTAPAQGVEEIITTLQLPDYIIAGIDLQIDSSNRMEYQFTHAERNVSLDPKLFELPATP